MTLYRPAIAFVTVAGQAHISRSHTSATRIERQELVNGRKTVHKQMIVTIEKAKCSELDEVPGPSDYWMTSLGVEMSGGVITKASEDLT